MSVLVERRLFTRQEYHAMMRAGILTEDDRVELIDGEIVRKMAAGPSRAGCVKRLNKLLGSLVGDAAIAHPRWWRRIDRCALAGQTTGSARSGAVNEP